MRRLRGRRLHRRRLPGRRLSGRRLSGALPTGATSVFPLEDLRVLDLSRVVSGPFAGRMLGDLGADVVKVEPPEGDISRVWGELRHGLSGFYTQQNAGKRNVCVDLRAPGAADVVVGLAAAADIMIENFRPGVLDRLGIGWDVLRAANPALILLSITGFGQVGPEAGRQAYAPVTHAESGLVTRQAEADGDRASDFVLSIADAIAGLHGLVAVLAAVHLRQRTGCGQRVDMAMADAMVASDDYAHHALDGSPLVRLGGEVWEAPGGPIMVAGVFRNTWKAVSSAHRLPDPAPAGADLVTKIALRRRVVADWMVGFSTRAALIKALEDAGVAWAELRTSTEALAGPTATARRAVAEVDDRGGGRRRVVQSPYRFSDASAGLRGGAPHRGEHNGEVLAEWLGWDASRVASLEAASVLLSARPADEP